MLSPSTQMADDNYVSLEKKHSAAPRSGQREELESPRANYENLKEFLGENKADDSYYNVADWNQEYQNVPTHLPDEYAAFEDVRRSAEDPASADAAVRERKVSQDNQYIYIKSQNRSGADVTANDILRARIRHLSEPTKKPVKYANLEYPLPPAEDEEMYTAVFGEEDKEHSTEGRREHTVMEFPVRREEESKHQVVQNARPSGGVDEGEEEGREHFYVNVKRPEEEEVLYQNITKTAATVEH